MTTIKKTSDGLIEVSTMRKDALAAAEKYRVFWLDFEPIFMRYPDGRIECVYSQDEIDASVTQYDDLIYNLKKLIST